MLDGRPPARRPVFSSTFVRVFVRRILAKASEPREPLAYHRSPPLTIPRQAALPGVFGGEGRYPDAAAPALRRSSFGLAVAAAVASWLTRSTSSSSRFRM